MFPFIPFPLIAGIIAIAGYRYLAKRQPEYPNARVIAVFTLLGGGLGGLLVTFLMYLTVVMNPPHLVDDSLPQSFLYLSVLLGGSMGCVPAALCGVWLAKEQLTRSWESSLMAAGYGAVSGVATGIVCLNIIMLLVFAPIGALSAAILAAVVLPKAE